MSFDEHNEHFFLLHKPKAHNFFDSNDTATNMTRPNLNETNGRFDDYMVVNVFEPIFLCVVLALVDHVWSAFVYIFS
jgi:hypothetical protein